MPNIDLGKVVGEQGPEGPVAQGTMMPATYDPNGKKQDVFAYADAAKQEAKDYSAPKTHASQHARGGSDPLTLANIAFLGDNPIASTADDTPERWKDLGTGYARYSASGQLTDQPGTYGILISYAASGDVFQIWKTQNNGPVYTRSGNASGWGQTWTKVYDTLNKPTASELGALPINGGEVNGPVTAVRFGQSNYVYPFETGQYIDMHLVDSTADYDGRLSLDSDKYLLYNGKKVYHAGNKPTLSELGIGNISQIAVGSYTGTGYATSENAPTLTFSFTPKFVLVMSMTDTDLGEYGYFIRDVGGYVQRNSFHIPSIEWGDKTLHYYTTNSYGSAFALNSIGIKYGYIAFG